MIVTLAGPVRRVGSPVGRAALARVCRRRRVTWVPSVYERTTVHVERNFSLARRYPPTNKANSPNLLAPVDSMLGRAGALLVGHAASTVLSRLNWTGCLPTQRKERTRS
eukprot:scaffold47795_cov68-Phaeocystis_antarctica.AAC.4